MVNVRAFGISGVSGIVLTWLGVNLNDAPIEPISRVDIPVNEWRDARMLKPWVSEEVFVQGDGTPYPDECEFFNFTSRHDSTYCDSFTVARSLTSMLATATERAVRCGVQKELECVLSHEVGLALPAAFLNDVKSQHGMRALVAPRVLSKGDETIHVRITDPDSENSRTVLMSTSVEVEFMDAAKRLQTETLEGDEAFCVQLLRASYEQLCWDKLDG